jgi:Winged helix DNA-binding domain
MPDKKPRLELSRQKILSFRRRMGGLDERLPAGAASLRQAAWAGLQDSMPRAALLSIHARVAGADFSTWEHPSLVQLWGPRYNDYVVAAVDLPIFSLGRRPENSRRRARADEMAQRLHGVLQGRRMPFGQAGQSLSVPHNSLRYAALTGTVLLRWDGARQPEVRTVPPPDMDPREARRELARRYLRIFGPGTPAYFARWAGVGRAEARAAFELLAGELTPVRTPLGEAWLLAADEPVAQTPAGDAAPARLLPSGDAYYLLWGTERELLVPDAQRRSELWTTRVWPGAVLVRGEIVGVWRRSAAKITIDLWRRLSSAEWAAAEAEALSLPLPGPLTVVKTGL